MLAAVSLVTLEQVHHTLAADIRSLTDDVNASREVIERLDSELDSVWKQVTEAQAAHFALVARLDTLENTLGDVLADQHNRTTRLERFCRLATGPLYPSRIVSSRVNGQVGS